MDGDNTNLEKRKLLEIEHSDKRRSIVREFEYFTDAGVSPQEVERSAEFEANFSNMKFYSISRASFAYRDRLLLDGISGKKALDYCCGNGEIAVRMALAGAEQVTGIDISSVAIENARSLAEKSGVSDRCEFQVMDAERTDFPDNAFDVVHEYGALHHLDLRAAYQELSRVLKRDGKLVCTEALRHNPLIHWYRKRTPQLRTRWEVEHILGEPEINSGKAFFEIVNARMFHLAALAAVPFRKTGLFQPLLSSLEAVDGLLLAVPLVRRMAWVSVIEFKKPVKSAKAIH